MKGLRPEAVVLALAAFLAPIIGGQVSQEPQPLSDNLLLEVFGGTALPLMTRALLGVLVLGALAVPVGIAIFNWGERYAKRTGRLKRSG